MGIWYDKEAYQILKKCSDAKDLTEWNEYRKTTNYAPINFRFIDMKNFYLQKAELQNVDLRGSDLNNANLYLADVANVNIESLIFWRFYFLLLCLGIIISWIAIELGTSQIKVALTSTIITILGVIVILVVFINYFLKLTKIIHVVDTIGVFTAIAGASAIIVAGISAMSYDDFSPIQAVIAASGMLFFFRNQIKNIIKKNQESIWIARNPEKAIGFDQTYINKSKSIEQSIEQELFELSKTIETIENNDEKQKILFKLQELENKKQFYIEQEKSAEKQKSRIEDVISELEAPYEYIHQTIRKIERFNRIFYAAIIGLIAFFLYVITHGYNDQRVMRFTSLFSKDMQPTFGTIFGVILFYGTPILLGISLIIYFIAQINKNIDKITELQEQERNIKQIASTIKAKAQIGMSDEEFVKETKNLIQKYQEGMMAGMFTKEKIADKEDKSSSSTYREKLIVNGMSKLLMQALKK